MLDRRRLRLDLAIEDIRRQLSCLLAEAIVIDRERCERTVLRHDVRPDDDGNLIRIRDLHQCRNGGSQRVIRRDIDVVHLADE